MKVLYLDTETTGLDAVKNDIIQIAGIVEINNEVKEEFNFTCQPFSYDNISQEALDIHGRKIDEIKTYQTPQLAYKQLLKIFDKYINKYDKMDKFIPAGHNIQFDVNFVFEFFKKNGNMYCGSYLDYHKLDSMVVGMLLKLFNKEKFERLKLEAMAKHYGMEINAHDALSDVKTSREIIKRFGDYLK